VALKGLKKTNWNRVEKVTKGKIQVKGQKYCHKSFKLKHSFKKVLFSFSVV